MLQQIHIANFRCFEDFSAKDFERVNLIGGKNNSGKTCLLEAIACLSNRFTHHHVADLRHQNANDLIYKNTISNQLLIDYQLENYTDYVFKFRLQYSALKQITSGRNVGDHNLVPINIITQQSELPEMDIIKTFDDFDEKLLKDKLVSILRIVDERIEDMRTFKTKEGLYIKPYGEEYESLSSFGDATKNLIRYFTPVFEKELTVNKEKIFSILLIDEIENGIHYTAHEEFWVSVFKLAKELNVQIFATTHSLEMIKIFNKVSLQEGDGAYYEMARELETGKIFAEKHDTELLQYELTNPKSTFRGE